MIIEEEMPSQRRFSKRGLMYGIVACFFWGFTDNAPDLVNWFGNDSRENQIPKLALTTFTFLWFGLTSVTITFFNHKNRIEFMKMCRSFCRIDWVMAVYLSMSGFWFYNFLLMVAVQKVGVVITSLMIGLLPVLIPISSSLIFDRTLPCKKMWTSTFFIVTGLLVLVFFTPSNNTKVETKITASEIYQGLTILVCCLFLWTSYSLLLSYHFLRISSKENNFDDSSEAGLPSSHVKITQPVFDEFQLTNLFGCLCFLVLGIFVTFAFIPQFLDKTVIDLYGLWNSAFFWPIIKVSFLVGVGSTFFAFHAWNICVKECSVKIYGPMLVLATVFSLLVTFILHTRLPFMNEFVAIILFCIGFLVQFV